MLVNPGLHQRPLTIPKAPAWHDSDACLHLEYPLGLLRTPWLHLRTLPSTPVSPAQLPDVMPQNFSPPKSLLQPSKASHALILRSHPRLGLSHLHRDPSQLRQVPPVPLSPQTDPLKTKCLEQQGPCLGFPTLPISRGSGHSPQSTYIPHPSHCQDSPGTSCPSTPQ